MGSVVDRRVGKTREALYSALVVRILDKGYDAVSVQDILDEANVGRSTFYGHFAGKEELLRYGFDRLRLQLAEQRTPKGKDSKGDVTDFLAFSLPLLRHARSHHQLYRAMIGGRGGLVAQQQLRIVVLDHVRQDLHGEEFDPVLPRELVVEFLAGAFLSVLHFWLDKKRKLEPEAIDDLFRRIAGEGLRAQRRAAKPDI